MMKTRKVLFIFGILIILVTAVFFLIMHHTYRAFMREETIPIDSKLLVVLGGGGNSGLLLTDSALVVIDTKMSGAAEKLFMLAKEKAGSKPVIVINTHYHGDHVGGNHFYKGSRIYIGSYDKDFLMKNIRPGDQPTDFVKDSLMLDLGDELLTLRNLGQAHTFDDMVVYLKNRKILFAGDLVQNHTNPFLIKESGADVDKWIKALGCIRCHYQVKMLVPGHGSLGDSTMVRDMKQYFDDMKTAASNPAQEKELVAKYKHWTAMPAMASPEKTISYIRSK